MHGSAVAPSLGVYATAIGPSSGLQFQHRGKTIRSRHGAKSAPAQFRYRRRERTTTPRSQNILGNRSLNKFHFTSPSPGFNRNLAAKSSSGGHGDPLLLRFDDVICLAEQTREAASQENRRSVLEEAQKTIRHEVSLVNSSRPHSVIGVGLQALTSPMPMSAKDRNSPKVQMDHIPTLLPLPSDRAFIPSPDHDNPRHVNTPMEDLDDEERCQSVARQCCEIMGPSMCKDCRILERRLLNREKAEKQYPRIRISQQNITTTQVVKRLYPNLSDSEIQDKIARGEIARVKFLSRKHSYGFDDDSDYDSGEDQDDRSSPQNELTPGHMIVSVTKKKKNENGGNVVPSDNPIFALTQLKRRLKGTTSTPLFFTDLKGIQAKILSGEVDRKKYLIKPPDGHVRLKSAVSTLSTASSNKSTLSKVGLRLSESLMPVFVSPRKVKICQEPSYKVYYEPPLLSRRRQIPNPAFFAGSSEAYSLPERLPDIIEFADSKIKALERQGRSTSSMSFASNISEETFDYEKTDPLSSSRREVDKPEREGEVMLGDSFTSSTPRMWLKSTNDVIDENLTGEEEHAKEDVRVDDTAKAESEAAPAPEELRHAEENGDGEDEMKTSPESEPREESGEKSSNPNNTIESISETQEQTTSEKDTGEILSHDKNGNNIVSPSNGSPSSRQQDEQENNKSESELRSEPEEDLASDDGHREIVEMERDSRSESRSDSEVGSAMIGDEQDVEPEDRSRADSRENSSVPTDNEEDFNHQENLSQDESLYLAEDDLNTEGNAM